MNKDDTSKDNVNKDNIDRLAEHFISQIELTITEIKQHEEIIKTSKQHLKQLKKILRRRMKCISSNDNNCI